MEQNQTVYSRIDWIILDRRLRNKEDAGLRRAFIVILGIHFLFFAIIAIATAIKKPMKPPEKVYSVKILQRSQEEVKVKDEPKIEEPEPVKEPEPEPEPEKPKVIEEDKKPKKEPEPEPTEEPEQKVSQEKVISAGDASVRVDGDNFQDDYYIMMIIRKISRFWQNPLRRSRSRVSAVVYFRINRDGSISEPEIEERSGNSLFDNSAIRAIKSATPLPELPQTYSGDHLGVHFEFEHKP